MRKKLIAMLCICMCILSLAACGADPTEIDYNGRTYEELNQAAVGTWENILRIDPAQIEAFVNQIDALPEAQRIAAMESEEGLKEQYELLKSWLAVSKEAGSYVNVDSFKVTMTGKTTTTDLYLNFEKRPVVFSIVYKNRNMSVESTTVDLVYSTGEKMQKALMNTVMGMGTVFVMLIVICLIISAFRIIPVIENKMKNRKNANAVTEAEAVPEPAAEEVIEETDNLELVAVIAAAIAADTGQSTDDFVVRSIKRRQREF